MKTMRNRTIGRRQGGIALIVVMVMLLLGSILVLGSSRTNWLNEALVGSESDYQRAYAAAEAIMADAEADIRGRLPGGAACNPLPNFVGCRDETRVYFPRDTVSDDLDLLDARLAGVLCRQGICRPPNNAGLGAGWWDANFAAMTANPRTLNAMAATYGEFTGANALATGNPILLVDADNPPRAWYWVEVFEFDTSSALNTPSGELPIPADNLIYRITAIAQGQRPGTRVVLRAVFVLNDSRLQS
jgi:type IV pilus assembly protein PilX